MKVIISKNEIIASNNAVVAMLVSIDIAKGRARDEMVRCAEDAKNNFAKFVQGIQKDVIERGDSNKVVVNYYEELVDRIAGTDMVRGVTVACGGFFGPQGRQLRIPLADPHQNEKIESFEYQGRRITNFEMESSALAGLARLQGHKATTVCMVIANRVAKEANTGYKNKIDDLIKVVLERI
jgi:uridine phosphorylase